MTKLPITKKTIKKIGLFFVAMAILLGALLAYRAIVKNNTYLFLEKAITTQPFSGVLDNPQRTSTECYPADGGSFYCLALEYSITETALKKIQDSLTQEEKSECCNWSFAFERAYGGRTVLYTISPGDESLKVYVYPN